jgi:hypothetical protein
MSNIELEAVQEAAMLEAIKQTNEKPHCRPSLP